MRLETIGKPTFNHELANNETSFVLNCALEIKRLHKQTQENIIKIGQLLLEVKRKLAHGQFTEWTEQEFSWSTDTAQRFMNAAKLAEEKPQIAVFANQIDTSALYLLCKPSTPKAIIEEVTTRAEAGERITHGTTKELLKQQTTSLHTPISTLPIASSNPVVKPTEPSLAPSPAIEIPIKKATHQLVNSSQSNEWYTPENYIEAVKEVLGAIDLDPASNSLADQTVKAKRFFSIDDDGLKQPWNGQVFLNPPYGFNDDGESNQAIWSKRLIEQYQLGITKEAILLVNASTASQWFKPLWDYPICFTDHRIKFYSSEENSNQPTKDNCFVYFGKQLEKFVQVFSKFGSIVGKVGIDEEGLFIRVGVNPKNDAA
jgi:hypothetical protein